MNEIVESQERVDGENFCPLLEVGEVKKDTHGMPFGWFPDAGLGGRIFAF